MMDGGLGQSPSIEDASVPKTDSMALVLGLTGVLVTATAFPVLLNPSLNPMLATGLAVLSITLCGLGGGLNFAAYLRDANQWIHLAFVVLNALGMLVAIGGLAFVRLASAKWSLFADFGSMKARAQGPARAASAIGGRVVAAAAGTIAGAYSLVAGPSSSSTALEDPAALDFKAALEAMVATGTDALLKDTEARQDLINSIRSIGSAALESLGSPRFKGTMQNDVNDALSGLQTGSAQGIVRTRDALDRMIKYMHYASAARTSLDALVALSTATFDLDFWADADMDPDSVEAELKPLREEASKAVSEMLARRRAVAAPIDLRKELEDAVSAGSPADMARWVISAVDGVSDDKLAERLGKPPVPEAATLEAAVDPIAAAIRDFLFDAYTNQKAIEPNNRNAALANAGIKVGVFEKKLKMVTEADFKSGMKRLMDEVSVKAGYERNPEAGVPSFVIAQLEAELAKAQGGKMSTAMGVLNVTQTTKKKVEQLVSKMLANPRATTKDASLQADMAQLHEDSYPAVVSVVQQVLGNAIKGITGAWEKTAIESLTAVYGSNIRTLTEMYDKLIELNTGGGFEAKMKEQVTKAVNEIIDWIKQATESNSSSSHVANAIRSIQSIPSTHSLVADGIFAEEVNKMLKRADDANDMLTGVLAEVMASAESLKARAGKLLPILADFKGNYASLFIGLPGNVELYNQTMAMCADEGETGDYNVLFNNLKVLSAYDTPSFRLLDAFCKRADFDKAVGIVDPLKAAIMDKLKDEIAPYQKAAIMKITKPKPSSINGGGKPSWQGGGGGGGGGFYGGRGRRGGRRWRGRT
jgi:uncharacterized membrane protein YgcG